MRIASCSYLAAGQAKVELSGECRSLAQLLQQLAPPGALPCSSLTLEGPAELRSTDGPERIPAALQGCTHLCCCTQLQLEHVGSVSLAGVQLPALRSLKLGTCDSVSVGGTALPALRQLSFSWLFDAKLDATLRALQQAAPQLCELDLRYGGGGGLSALPSLQAIPGLRKLRLPGEALASLPEGPWLHGEWQRRRSCAGAAWQQVGLLRVAPEGRSALPL